MWATTTRTTSRVRERWVCRRCSLTAPAPVGSRTPFIHCWRSRYDGVGAGASAGRRRSMLRRYAVALMSAFGLVPVQNDELEALFEMFEAYHQEVEPFDPFRSEPQSMAERRQ